MVPEIVYTFENNYNKDDLTLKIPEIFQEISTKDARMELVTSNTLCPLKLFFSHNLVTKTIAYIFCNTNCNGVEYNDAEVAREYASDLFNNVL